MDSLFFLQDDYEALQREIVLLTRRISEVGREMGRSCEEGAETFHDNFAFEDGERQFRMWTRRLRDLVHIRAAARVVQVSMEPERVAIGTTAAVLDLGTGRTSSYLIGSYMNFNSNGAISYLSPLARLLLGAAPGDVRSGDVAGRYRAFEIVEVLPGIYSGSLKTA